MYICVISLSLSIRVNKFKHVHIHLYTYSKICMSLCVYVHTYTHMRVFFPWILGVHPALQIESHSQPVFLVRAGVGHDSKGQRVH